MESGVSPGPILGIDHWYRFAGLCSLLAATRSKLAKRDAMSNYLAALDAPAAALAAQYLAGAAFPETDARSLRIGGQLLVHAIEQVSGATPASFHAAYRKHGDLGAAAEELLRRGTRQGSGLTLQEIAGQFDTLAATRTQAARLSMVVELLRFLSPLETKYFIKLVLGDMRIGVKQGLVEEAIAAAAREDIAAVRRAGMFLGSLPEVVALAWRHELHTAQFRMFHPLGFMLATPAASAADAFEHFQEKSIGTGAETSLPGAQTPAQIPARIFVQMEDKYDGMRAQIHCGDPAQPGRVRIFSRNREDVTASFPELAEWFAHSPVPAILDGEILAWNFAAERAAPFASLQQRLGRKRVTAAMRDENPVVFMAFDRLLEADELLLDTPLAARRARLERFAAAALELPRPDASTPPDATPDAARQQSLFGTETVTYIPVDSPRLRLAPVEALSTAEQIDTAFAAARMRGNEGVMLKLLNSTYQPGRRGSAWLKLKRELATLDVVVTAVEYGHGKRAGVLSDYTFAVRDGERLRNVGKAYSGLTDKEIAALTEWFLQHTLDSNNGRSLLVEPKIVLEVAFNNVMRSARHDSGYALRFPRIVRLRPDKPIEEIDTIQRVEEVLRTQPEIASDDT